LERLIGSAGGRDRPGGRRCAAVPAPLSGFRRRRSSWDAS